MKLFRKHIKIMESSRLEKTFKMIQPMVKHASTFSDLALYYQRVRSAHGMKYENKENEFIFTYTVSWLFGGVHIY